MSPAAGPVEARCARSIRAARALSTQDTVIAYAPGRQVAPCPGPKATYEIGDSDPMPVHRTVPAVSSNGAIRRTVRLGHRRIGGQDDPDLVDPGFVDPGHGRARALHARGRSTSSQAPSSSSGGPGSVGRDMTSLSVWMNRPVAPPRERAGSNWVDWRRDDRPRIGVGKAARAVADEHVDPADRTTDEDVHPIPARRPGSDRGAGDTATKEQVRAASRDVVHRADVEPFEFATRMVEPDAHVERGLRRRERDAEGDDRPFRLIDDGREVLAAVDIGREPALGVAPGRGGRGRVAAGAQDDRPDPPVGSLRDDRHHVRPDRRHERSVRRETGRRRARSRGDRRG